MAKLKGFNMVSINDIMEEGDIIGNKRTYLGYSGLGGNCMRKVWYSFRWVADDSATRRMNRIWERGHIEEPRIIKDLARIGCIVVDREFTVVGITGHAQGHGDGKAVKVPTYPDPKAMLLFEAKTMKHSSYVKYLKEGLQRYSSSYWQQIHSYMGHEKLPACLYVVTNKDTEERDYKIIDYDHSQFEEGERIAFNIITAEVPPPRMQHASAQFFECKWCCFRNVCHKDAVVDANCRTCKHWDICDEGKFECGISGMELTKAQQVSACIDYELDKEAYCG